MSGQSTFCASHIDKAFTSNDDWEELHSSSFAFMESLALPRHHPHCMKEIPTDTDYVVGSVPLADELLGSELFYENDIGAGANIFTLYCQIAPALLAITELWLRLFAVVLAPLAAFYLFSFHVLGCNGKEYNFRKFLASLIGLASCSILITDAMYVHAFGRTCGFSFFILMTGLSTKNALTMHTYRRRTITSLVVLLIMTVYLLLNTEGTGSGFFDNPGIDTPSIQEGLYYSENNQMMKNIVELWPEQSRTYNVMNGATPYLPTGDSLTGIPFLVNSSPEQNYHRVWVEIPHDDEAVALDIAFPPDGVHSSEKPVILVLHGLNGGSNEEYVREFVASRTREGHTCVVMIARGLMDTPVAGWNVFHGARIIDLDESARALRKVLYPNQILVGVGYSMGAIVISNYVSRSGKRCQLDAAMAISGGLDMREMLRFKRSMRLWQPMLAQGLREDFIVSKFDGRFRQRLNRKEHLALMRASSVTEIDLYGIVAYNGFDGLIDYYTEMSAMGDTEVFRHTRKYTSIDVGPTIKDNHFGRIQNVSVPFCVLHALDDPITTWRTMGNDPEALTKTGKGMIMMLLTKTGGHVGWPVGLYPWKNGWSWMNNAAKDFINSVNEVMNESPT